MSALLFALLMPVYAGSDACALPEGWLSVDVDGNRRGCACVGLGRTPEGGMEALVRGTCAVELTVDATSCGSPLRLLLQQPAEGEDERRYPLTCADMGPLGGEIRALSARRVR